jgi:hypothetical protein
MGGEIDIGTETAGQRTLRMMREKPGLLDHAACNNYEHAQGVHPSRIPEAEQWENLTEEVREQWRQKTLDDQAQYIAMTPEEQQAHNDASLRETIRQNDAAFD